MGNPDTQKPKSKSSKPKRESDRNIPEPRNIPEAENQNPENQKIEDPKNIKEAAPKQKSENVPKKRAARRPSTTEHNIQKPHEVLDKPAELAKIHEADGKKTPNIDVPVPDESSETPLGPTPVNEPAGPVKDSALPDLTDSEYLGEPQKTLEVIDTNTKEDESEEDSEDSEFRPKHDFFVPIV